MPSPATAADVHAHTHPAGFAEKADFTPDSGSKSARADATPARVIPLRKDLRQGDRQTDRPAGREARPAGPGQELGAGLKAARDGAAGSELARSPVTVLDALEQIAPSKGEAGNWIAWTAMVLAGLLRLGWLSLGHLIAFGGGQTRIRAAVATGALMAAVVISWALRHAT